ncbi:hypothetical protein BL250_00810 [Erwinia sp. OLTSP20]|nr:hypothetical protein BK416_14585 [Erwinia sp. OLSSP12]PIJ79181.1 hypothetical protein BLD47_14890 [Erwinia sp. OLCASP19]PIJ80707.1 hypothetical protein BLD46_14050 [Erwinia sp. OLMTSP26]PIJ82857.1 hypothetical protein BLD49_13945 [Erwinia sp. OLMDSP33]PIJ91711.1 hypothetical protein BL249_07755 [Erwinia sp. OLFS4]PIJ95315.1 hypothetical protein BL250_00810 [Erwinia sp. OLTSP20]
MLVQMPDCGAMPQQTAVAELSLPVVKLNFLHFKTDFFSFTSTKKKQKNLFGRPCSRDGPFMHSRCFGRCHQLSTIPVDNRVH